jgi:ribosomal protein L7Ae-like RNA K-turn-binding protein
VAAGTDAVREAIRDGRARVVITARDASPAQTAKVRRSLAGHPIPHRSWGSRVELGGAVGVASLAVVAVTHPKLAAEVAEALDSYALVRVGGGES